MYSYNDFEIFFLRYKAEAEYKGISIQKFCIDNNMPYDLYIQWYRDSRSKKTQSPEPYTDHLSHLTAKQKSVLIDFLLEKIERRKNQSDMINADAESELEKLSAIYESQKEKHAQLLSKIEEIRVDLEEKDALIAAQKKKMAGLKKQLSDV